MLSKKEFFAEWLEKLQQESWQLELLISGLALYGIYASADMILSLEYYFQVNGNSTFRFAVTVFINLLWVSRTIFLINLLVHIIIRGFWIGAIGLRYVSGEIDYKALNYSELFTNYYKKRIGSFDEYIEKLEKFSSVLFSFTFLLFFLLVSFFIFNFVFIGFSSLITKVISLDPQPGSGGFNVMLFAGAVYYICGFLVLIDFVTLGAFKKISDKTVGGIYLWIYRFYSLVSLSFLYRPILLNFLDDKYTKRLFFFAIPYTIFLFLLNGYNIERHEYFPAFNTSQSNYDAMSEDIINYKFYDDLREEYTESLEALGKRKERPSINMISLSQYEVDKSELKIFLEYEQYDSKSLEDIDDNLSPYRKEGLRHNWQNSTAEDNSFKEIVDRQMIDIKQSLLIGTSGSIEKVMIAKYGDFEGDRNELQERIDESFDIEKSNYSKLKSNQIKRAFKNLYDIRLNNQSINDKLDCKYYIHPNMLEKGLLCYFNIDSIKHGGHTLNITKGDRRKFNIPFRKLKQNQ